MPFFLALMEHLASARHHLPAAGQEPRGRDARQLAGRPAAIVTFLDGMWMRRPSAGHCAARRRGAGAACISPARISRCGARMRSRSPAGGRFQQAAHARRRGAARLGACSPRSSAQLENALAARPAARHHPCRSFPRQCLLSRRQLSGLIDFYFACTDTLAYDVAICLNAWCFEADHSYNVTKGRALLRATPRPGLCRRPNARNCRCFRAARRCASCSRGWSIGSMCRRARWCGRRIRSNICASSVSIRKSRACAIMDVERRRELCRAACRHPYRRRLLGQSGSRRLGRDPRRSATTKRNSKAASSYHQQPHGTDGGDLGAGSAQAAVPGRYPHRQQYLRNGIMSWITPGNATAGERRTRSRSRMSISGSASTRRSASTRCTGIGCKGHSGHD